jgi:hypothetical protein
MSRRRDWRLAGRLGSFSPAACFRRRSHRLALERLEDRTLLAYNVAQAFGLGANDIVSKAVVVDSSGNTYLAGGFTGTVSFDPTGAAAALTSANSSRDVFVAKYSPNNTLLWSKDFGGSLTDLAYALVQDSASGNLYVAGSYQGTAAFGSVTLTAASGATDAFLAKLDPNGNVLWAVSGGGANSTQANALGLDSAGNIYAAGQFTGTATLGSASLTSAGGTTYSDAFVAKYSPTGSVLWATGLGGSQTTVAVGLAVDSSGNVYATGSLYGTGTFGSVTLTSAGGYDAFLVKLNTSGTVVWADDFGGTGTDQAKTAAVDSTGNVFVAGQFQNTAAFGSVSLTSAGNFDAFVTKVLPTGVVSWAKSFGSAGTDCGQAVAADSTGAVTVVGQFSNTVTFGAGTALESNGGTDVFVLRLDGSGNFGWAQDFGGGSNDTASAVVVDSHGGVTLSGSYVGPVVFGSNVLENLGTANIFVALLSANAAPPPPSSVTGFGLGAGDLLSKATAVDAGGNMYIAGGFTGTVSFDPAGVAAPLVSNSSSRDVYVARYASSDALLWAKDFGGSLSDLAYSLVFDSVSDSLYVAGTYVGSATFGNTTLTSTTGATDSFLAKLDLNGNVLWAVSAGGANTTQVNALGLDSAGNIYAAGQYTGTATFGSVSLTSTGGTSSSNAFVAKYSPSGSVLWATSMGGTLTSLAVGVAVDSSGNVYAAGTLYGSGSFGSVTLTSAGGYDAFLAKLDTSGTVSWADDFGGTGTDQAKAVAVDSAGNAIMTGQFQNTAAFGSVSLTSAGGFDAFVTKVSSSGVVSWAKGFGSTGTDSGATVAVDSTGAVTVAGQFSNTVTFGTSATLTSAGGTDVFVLHLDGSGNFGWVKGYGGSGNDTATSVALVSDGSGDVVLTGSYGASAIFDTMTLASLGTANIYLVRIKNPAAPVSVSASTLSITGFLSPAPAGSSQSFTVTAKDANGNVVTGYTGTVHFTSSDAQAVLPANYTFTTTDAGVHTFSATLKTSGTQSITATDTAKSSTTGTETGISVSAAAASVLVVAGFPSPTTVGASQSFAITAKDAYGNIATGYTGTVHFTSSDAQAALPANYTFSSGDAGTHTCWATFETIGTQSLTSTDTVTSSTTGTQTGIAVNPATAATLSVAGFPSSTTAGASQTFTVTARDSSGNIATGYTGTVHFTSSDAQAALPANYTFTAGDAGVHTFSTALKTSGTQSITATDTLTSTITGLQTGITVSPAAASSLVVAGFPSSTTVSVLQSFTVTAKDAYGNVATGYTGTAHFTSSDLLAVLPANYTYTAADAGVHTFSASLATVGTQSITATDTVTGTITGSQTGISVLSAVSATASTLTVAGFPSTTTAGVAQSFTVTAKDASGNIVTGYTGTVHFTSNDSQAALPANYTFTAADAGVHTFTATLKTAGPRSITATDTVTATLTGMQSRINVNPGPLNNLHFTGYPSPTTAGVSHSFTITARDAYTNTITNYTGTVHFTSTDPKAILPADYTFTAADGGTHSFSAATLETAGYQYITASDAVAGVTTTNGGKVVAAAAVSAVVSGYPSTVKAGTAANFTVTLYDSYGNIATGYTGTIHFTSDDPLAILPADYTFTATDNGKHTFTATFKTTGTHSLTVTDTGNASLTGTQSGILVQ